MKDLTLALVALCALALNLPINPERVELEEPAPAVQWVNEDMPAAAAGGLSLLWVDTDLLRETVTLSECTTGWTSIGTDDFETWCDTTGPEDCEITWQTEDGSPGQTWGFFASCGLTYRFRLYLRDGNRWTIEIWG